MSNLSVDLSAIAAVLERHKVDFVVVGGMAVVLQGGDTTTLDVDLAFEQTAENLNRLANALQELSARPKRWAGSTYRLSAIDLASKWLHLESPFGDIDLIAELPGISYPSLRAGADSLDIGGLTISVASIRELIQIKSASSRRKDLDHVEELEALLRLKDGNRIDESVDN